MPYRDPGAARVARNWVIRMPIVSRCWFVDRKNNSAILVKEPARDSLRKAAEVLAYQFKRETRFDFAPYTASARNAAQEVWLLPSQMVLLGGSEAIACAIGVIFRPPGWHVHWLWVHPYERGQGLIDEAWPHMVHLVAGQRRNRMHGAARWRHLADCGRQAVAPFGGGAQGGR
jgi:hypothetical protein